MTDPRKDYAKLLFKLSFLIRVKRKYLVDPDEEPEFEQSQAHEELLADLAEEEEEIPLTLVSERQQFTSILDIFERGGGFTFVEPKDSMKAYDILTGHLRRWTTGRVNNPTGAAMPPLEDLQRLDKLAGAVYDCAKKFYRIEKPKHNLFAELERMTPFKDKGVPKHDIEEEHNPLTDLLTAQTKRRINQWK